MEVVFGLCDLTPCKIDLGNFKWVIVDNCWISRANVFDLLATSTQVTFKECTFGPRDGASAPQTRRRRSGTGPVKRRSFSNYHSSLA